MQFVGGNNNNRNNDFSNQKSKFQSPEQKNTNCHQLQFFSDLALLSFYSFHCYFPISHPKWAITFENSNQRNYNLQFAKPDSSTQKKVHCK